MMGMGLASINMEDQREPVGLDISRKSIYTAQ